MLVTLIRTLIIFITLFTVIRLMGKRQIGEMQPFEFIITLIIADLACIPMSDVSTLGRITSGVKLINLDEGVTVAQIAKVREKISDGNQEYDNMEDAMEEIPEQEYLFSEEEEITLPKEDDEE